MSHEALAKPSRLAIVVTHPIQHFCPQYRSLAQREDIRLRVVFGSLKGVEPYVDPGFGREVSWGRSLLIGFDWVDAGGSSDKIIDALDDFRPDWVIVYGHSTSASRAAIRWLLRNRGAASAYVSDTEMRHGSSRLRRMVKVTVLRLFFWRFSAFLTVGDANEEFYRAAGVSQRRLVRMHFPIDPAYQKSPDGQLAREKRADLGIPSGATVIMNVGKLVSRKRQRDLIEAVRRLGAGCHLVLLGSGPDEDMLRAAANGLTNVSFAGFVAPAELPSWYAIADVYAHVSDYDPHPLAVSEAALSSCALVASSATGSWGPTDDVVPGVTGIVVPVADVDELTEALRRVSADRELRSALAEQARILGLAHQRRAHGGFIPDMLSLRHRPRRRSQRKAAESA